MSDKEEWRWVPGYEGLYMVSNMGNVVSVPRRVSGKRFTKSIGGRSIKAQQQNSGYLFVCLYAGSKGKQSLVHRLVAEAFIPNPGEKSEVNHKNGDKHDNRAENLEWVTCSENKRHAIEVLGKRPWRSKLTDEEVEAIRGDTRPQSAIASEYGISQTVVCAVQTGKTHKRQGGPIRAKQTQGFRQRKLSASDIQTIRSSHETGKALARRFGVAASTISKIRSNKRYKEVVCD